MIPLAYNVRSLAVRKATTAAAALGLGLVVFVFASVLMLTNGIRQATARASIQPDRAIVLRKGASAEIESGIGEEAEAIIGASPGVARAANGHALAVGEVIVLVLLDKSGGGGFSNVELRGVPDGVLEFRPSVSVVEGRAPRPGTNEAMVGRAIRGRFKGLDMGQKLEMRRNHPLEIVGVFADHGSSYESELWADAHVIQAMFGRKRVVSSVRVRLTDPGAFESFRAALDANPALAVTALREAEFAEKQTQGTSRFVSAMGFIVAFFFSLGAVIGAMITMHATVAHRRREIGTLRALGFSRAQILVSFLIESTLLSLLGGVLGAAASLLLSFSRVSMMNFSTYAEFSFRFEPSPRILAQALAVAALMGVIGGLLPAVRASRTNPIQAMRGG